MLSLYIQARIGSANWFSVGAFRPTYPIITPSQAAGLILNIAAIDINKESNIPSFKLAIGFFEQPTEQSRFCQIHKFPQNPKEVKDKMEKAGKPSFFWKNMKPQIATTNRAFLTNLKLRICIDGNSQFEERIKQGIKGKLKRRGVIFMGDNQNILDYILVQDDNATTHKEIRNKKECKWLVKHSPNELLEYVPFRMPIKVNREDNTKTQRGVFKFTEKSDAVVPNDAWVDV